MKDIGVMVDCALSFRNQIIQVVKLAGYHLRNIAFVRKYLNGEIIKMLIHNYVIKRIDYCNALYHGLSNYLLHKLQIIMNKAARLRKGLSSRERTTPALIDLHWLPIKARIMCKLCVLTYQALKFGKPAYLRDLLKYFHIDSNMVLRHATEIQR